MSNLPDLKDFLYRNFQLDSFTAEMDSESAYLNEIHRRLTAKIKWFIQFRMDDLLQALYRIDVPQGHSDQAFELGEIDKISSRLSELIIQRQLQKLDYSRKFRSE